jgi:hypothetical protein
LRHDHFPLCICQSPEQTCQFGSIDLRSGVCFWHKAGITAAERMAAGDPRPSVQEGYPSFAMYRSALMRTIDDLVRTRFMLCEDAAGVFARLLQAGLDAGVPAPKGTHLRKTRCLPATQQRPA